ncbi:MAG: methyltransferase domain-containing protein, partial [Gammaproteobacteria bacterium]
RQREREVLRRALRTGRASSLHGMAGDRALADLLRTMLADCPLGEILHVGCGSGQVLGLLLADACLAVGTEPSGHLRQLARLRLRQAGLPRWTVREAKPHQLPFDADAFDVVILEDALGKASGNTLESSLAEAARVLRPAGRLLLLDRILPTDSILAARLAALNFAVTRRQWLPGRAPDRALFLASRPTATHARTGTDD